MLKPPARPTVKGLASSAKRRLGGGPGEVKGIVFSIMELDK